jgi:error-prone DNA polymerase
VARCSFAHGTVCTVSNPWEPPLQLPEMHCGRIDCPKRTPNKGECQTIVQKVPESVTPANGYELAFAEQCFNQIKGFGEYGFPESHAARFALLVYASSWLKRFHPAAFAAALLNSQPMGFYAQAQIVRDAKEHGVEVQPLDVNYSEWDCTPEPAPPMSTEAGETGGKEGWGLRGLVLRLGLRLVKGLSSANAETIARERQRRGSFASIPIFPRRTALPRHVMERLAQADAFGSLRPTRRGALWEVLVLSSHCWHGRRSSKKFHLVPQKGL